MPKFKLVVAFDNDKIIGKKGSEKLLWHIPEDLAHFKKLTEGQVVLMGKSTFESLPSFAKPLPNRVNLVLSRTDQGEKDGAIFGNLDELLLLANKYAQDGKELFAIGGASVYKLFIEQNLAQTIFATRINASFESKTQGDEVRFPDFEDKFILVSKEELQSKSGYTIYFEKWEI